MADARTSISSAHHALLLIKTTHTLVWALFGSAVVALPIAVARAQWRLALILIALVTFECLILVFNHMKCPLTALAARYTEDRRDNFDIYLPLWLARYNKHIFGTLFALGLLYTLVSWRFRSG